jgi:hypothetical protein
VLAVSWRLLLLCESPSSVAVRLLALPRTADADSPPQASPASLQLSRCKSTKRKKVPTSSFESMSRRYVAALAGGRIV